MKKEVESLGKTAKAELTNEVNKLKRNATHEINAAGKKIKDDLGNLPKIVEEAAKSIFEDIAAIATKEGAKKICTMLSSAIDGMAKLEKSKPKLS